MKTYYVYLGKSECPDWAEPIKADSLAEAAKRRAEYEVEDRGLKHGGEVFDCYVSDSLRAERRCWRLIKVVVSLSSAIVE